MSSHHALSAGMQRMLASALYAALIVGLAFGHLGYAAASRSAETPNAPAAGLSAAELEELVGPVALYPDELLAITLPAATYPLQIVQAARVLEKRKTEPDLQPDEGWDESVIGLMNYPEVIDLMNEDLDWTWKLGEAVADQQDDVMDAVQSFRAKVDDAGNLESNEQVTVVKEIEEDQQIIVIESKSTEVIYVPTYQPTTVVVQQTVPYTYVYSSPYPYYYRPAAAFWTGMFVGAAVGWGLSWGRRGWGRSSINVNRNVNVNVNRPTRPSTPNRPNNPSTRPGGGGGGGQQKWKADKGRGTQSGGRPGGDRANAGNRPAGGGPGSRPSTSTRPAGGQGGQKKPSAGGGTRPSTGGGKTRPSSGGGAAGGGKATRPSTGSKPSGSASRGGGSNYTRSKSPSKGSSVGSYGNGSKSRSSASRGSSSRGRSGGGSRGGGRGGGRR